MNFPSSLFHRYLSEDVQLNYSLFHKTLPKSSVLMPWISVRFYEMGDIQLRGYFWEIWKVDHYYSEKWGWGWRNILIYLYKCFVFIEYVLCTCCFYVPYISYTIVVFIMKFDWTTFLYRPTDRQTLWYKR